MTFQKLIIHIRAVVACALNSLYDRKYPCVRKYACVLLFVLVFSACAPARPLSVQPVDDTARIAILSAFEPELKQILAQIPSPRRYEINGRSFYTGQLSRRDVVVFLSGVSMVNAAMNTQLVIDHFHITGIVFSGIAGGVNPDLHVGDVVIPGEWAQYQEQVFARQSGQGWTLGLYPARWGNYGMMFPQPVTVTRSGGALDSPESKFWFAVDQRMLAAAQKASSQVRLNACQALGYCLKQAPRIILGGKGLSGSTYVDNADYRAWVWQNFHADALDMESAAVAQVAFANAVPFIAFRSLSDLAGGGPGQAEILIFMQLAADNASRMLTEFLKVYP